MDCFVSFLIIFHSKKLSHCFTPAARLLKLVLAFESLPRRIALFHLNLQNSVFAVNCSSRAKLVAYLAWVTSRIWDALWKLQGCYLCCMSYLLLVRVMWRCIKIMLHITGLVCMSTRELKFLFAGSLLYGWLLNEFKNDKFCEISACIFRKINWIHNNTIITFHKKNIYSFH